MLTEELISGVGPKVPNLIVMVHSISSRSAANTLLIFLCSHIEILARIITEGKFEDFSSDKERFQFKKYFSQKEDMDPEESLLPHLHGTLVVRIEEARRH